MESININVTINTVDETIGRGKTTKADKVQETRQPIDRTKEELIPNETSYTDLLEILRSRPEAVKAARDEAEEKEREEKVAKLRKLYGEDYDRLFGDQDKNILEKANRRPGAVHLRTYEPRIARMEIGEKGVCEVYANGYAVYDNGDRKTVLWVPDCGKSIYNFTQLRDSERKPWSETDEFGHEYEVRMKERDEIDEDILGPAPWYNALTIAGENRIEQNLDHPKSVGTTSDSDDKEEFKVKEQSRWVCGASFPDPEDTAIGNVMAEGIMDGLLENQKKIVELRRLGYRQSEIARMLGITRQSVNETISYVRTRVREMKKILIDPLTNVL